MKQTMGERDIPARGLNWQTSIGGAGICPDPSIWQIASFCSFSLILVGDAITSFYLPKVLRRQDVFCS